MLKKKDAIPGAVIVFSRSPLVSILPVFGKNTVVQIYGAALDSLDGNGKGIFVKQNDVATVLIKPKKYLDGINCICLSVYGKKAYFYWADVYHNATLVKSGSGTTQEI